MRYILILLGLMPVLSSPARQAVVSVNRDHLAQVKVSAYSLKHTSTELEGTGYASFHFTRIPSGNPVVPAQLSEALNFSGQNFFNSSEACGFTLPFKEYLNHIYPSHNFW